MIFKIVLGAALVYAVYIGVVLVHANKIAKETVRTTTPFRSEEGKMSLLVAGDSTAYGVGASEPKYSVPGRLSAFLGVSVENVSKSGAKTRDVMEQLSRAQKSTYDTILIQVGANDVIYFKSLARAEEELRKVLTTAREKSPRVLVLTAGDIGAAHLFPWPLSTIHTYRTQNLRERFMRVCGEFGAVYVDIYSRPDPFASDPEKYYAPDGLHLSDSGYAFWFDIVREYVEKNRPELIRNQ